MKIFYITYILWLLSEIFLNRFVRSGKQDKKSADMKTEIYIWLTVALTITNASVVKFIYPIPIFSRANYAITGLIAILTGMLIRFLAIKQLGRFFTVDVTIRKDHKLMQSGFYKYLRHPSYTGSLLSFLGFGLSLQ